MFATACAMRTPIVILALGLSCFAAAPSAKTIIVEPDPCAIPADVAPYEADLEAIAAEDARWREALGGVLLIYPPEAPGWASRRLRARFVIDPVEVFADAPVESRLEPRIVCVPTRRRR